jgi:hypothetical protein
MSYDNLLAGNSAVETFTPVQLFASGAEVRTLDNQILDTGNLAQFTVLGRITATGKWIVYTPGATDGSENAAGILVHAADATSADKVVQVYVAGDFNHAVLIWPAAIDTLIERQTAFNRSPITVNKLMYSVG